MTNTGIVLLDKALEYAKSCVYGDEITTWEVKRQCEIFLNDYNERQYCDDFDYYFNLDEVTLINDLIGLMYYATGFVAGKCILDGIAGFQALILVNIFGWRFKNNHKKLRYKDIIMFIPRKTAKFWRVK